MSSVLYLGSVSPPKQGLLLFSSSMWSNSHFILFPTAHLKSLETDNLPLTLSGQQPDCCSWAEHHCKTNTRILQLDWCSQSPQSQSWWLVWIHNNTVFLIIYITAYYIVYIHTKFDRDLWRNTKVMGHWVRLPVKQKWSSSAQRHRQAWSKTG